MKRHSLGTRIWDGFRRTNGPATGVIGLLLAILLWKVSPEAKVGVLWVVIAGLVTYLMIATLFSVVVDLWKDSAFVSPEVKAVLKETLYGKSDAIILVVEPSNHISMDSIVSIFFCREDDFEVQIGVGAVINIQENALIQIAVLQMEPAQEEIFDKLQLGDTKKLRRVLVKPSIPRTALERFAEINSTREN